MDQGLPPPSADGALREELLAGLSAPQKRLPSKLFYDARGSQLFDAICELPEYYVTRTELAIMRAHAGEMATAIGGEARLVEYGSGSSVKTRLLLDALPTLSDYVPVDISGEHLHATAGALQQRYPKLAVRPLAADFTRAIELPTNRSAARIAVYFPGSTLGNFEPAEALALLHNIRRLAGNGGGLLLGADLRKPLDVLLPAYDDAQGTTAAFNLNLLHRLNREFGADFVTEDFAHLASWNETASRIEMHLKAGRATSFSLFGQRFEMRAGETLHTENSHKYSPDALADLAERSGFEIAHTWTDPHRWFAVQWWRTRPRSLALAA